MNSRDQTPEDRAELLLEQIKPDLLSLLRNAPEYGSCGIDVFLHQRKVIRISIRSEITRKVQSRTAAAYDRER
jgi:hypothetical protein